MHDIAAPIFEDASIYKVMAAVPIKLIGTDVSPARVLLFDKVSFASSHLLQVLLLEGSLV